MPTIKVTVQTNKIGSDVTDEFEAPDGWDEMTNAEKRAELTNVEQEHVDNFVEVWARVYDDAGEEITDFAG